jgi:hypothetical protein
MMADEYEQRDELEPSKSGYERISWPYSGSEYRFILLLCIISENEQFERHRRFSSGRKLPKMRENCFGKHAIFIITVS